MTWLQHKCGYIGPEKEFENTPQHPFKCPKCGRCSNFIVLQQLAPIFDKCESCDRNAIVESCHRSPSHGFCRNCQFHLDRLAKKTHMEEKEMYQRIRGLNAKMDELRLLRGIPV